MHRITKSINKHKAALAMLTGATAFFIANYSLSLILTPTEYGVYSLIATLTTITTSFGLLGHEQSLLRLSKIKCNTLHTPKKELQTSIALCLVSPICATSYAAASIDLSPFNILSIYIFITLTLTATLYCYLDRARGALFHSQLHSNTWKISLFCSTFIAFFSPSIHTVLISATTIHIITTIITLVTYPTTTAKISTDKTAPYSPYLNISFLITMITIATLSYGDRIYVQQDYGLDILGKIFFYQNLILSPLLLLANYLALNEVQFLREGRQRSETFQIFKIKSLIAIAIFIIGSSIILAAPVEDGYILICIVTLAIGAVRIPYSTISAIQSVLSSPSHHLYANIIAVLPIASFLLISQLDLIESASLPIFYASILSGWILRSAYILLALHKS